MSAVRVVRSVQIGEARHGSSLCLLADLQDDGEPVYAVCVRLNDFLGHWEGGHLVTRERWTDANLRRVLEWRQATDAEAEFRERLALFPDGARLA